MIDIKEITRKDVLEDYVRQVNFTTFLFEGNHYYSFVCSTEDEIEIAFFLVGYHLGLNLKEGFVLYCSQYGRYYQEALQDASEEMLDIIHSGKKAAYYFVHDDSGDYPCMKYGLLSDICQTMKDDLLSRREEYDKVSNLLAIANTKGITRDWATYVFDWNGVDTGVATTIATNTADANTGSVNADADTTDTANAANANATARTTTTVTAVTAAKDLAELVHGHYQTVYGLDGIEQIRLYGGDLGCAVTVKPGDVVYYGHRRIEVVGS